MCNGMKANGEKCGRKAEWCFQHLNQKPVETPVIAEPVVVSAPVAEEPIAAPVVEEIAVAPVVEEIVAAPVVEGDVKQWSHLIVDVPDNYKATKADIEAYKKLTLTAEQIQKVVLYSIDLKVNPVDTNGDEMGFEYEPDTAEDSMETLNQWLQRVAQFANGRGIVLDDKTQTIIDRVGKQYSDLIGMGGDFSEFEAFVQELIGAKPVAKPVAKKISSFEKKPVADHYGSGAFDIDDDELDAWAAKAKPQTVSSSVEGDDDGVVVKNVAKAVIKQKNEEPELIEAEEEFVSENIVSPMSPNTAIATPQPELPILEETNPAPIKKIFSERACLQIHRGNEYQYWIDHCALGRAEVSFKLLKPNGDYCYEIKGCHVLQVYKYEGGRVISRPFVWFGNPVDMFAFIKYFHSDSANNESQFECHEVFVGRDPTVKIFFDIEKAIPTEFYNGLKADCGNTDAGVGEQICRDVMTGLKGTLEEFDLKFDLYESDIDYAIVSRTRAVDGDNTKVSYHLITNIAMRVSECKAIVKALKAEHLGTGLTMSDEYRDLLCSSSTVDINPYRKNGTLSLPGGRKNGHQLTIIREFKCNMDLHLVEIYNCHRYHEFSDELLIQAGQSSREAFEESSSEFVKKALAKLTVDRVPAYDPKAMDLWANSPRGNYLFVKRTAPSHCPECDRTHDNADTLLLIFNESKGIALWKCSHNEDMKAKRWFGKSGQKEYEIDAITDDDIEAFAKTLTSRAVKAEEAEKAKEVEKKKEAEDRMSNQEAIRELPTWDITIDKDIIPPIHDIHNSCCYADYITLGQDPISGEEAMKYIYNNFALILNGGNSFFISKNFSYRLNGNRETCEISYQYLKYKSINNTPGELQVKLTNPETKNEEIHIFPIWKLLLRWQSHIAYSEIRFSPYGARIGYDWSNKKVFNTFTGFVNQFDPDFVIDESKFERFFAHFREAWCDDDIELFEFTVKLFAYMVQFPHLKTAVAMIVMGPEGLG